MVQVRHNPDFSLQATTNSLWAMAVLGSAHNSTAMRLVQYLYSHEDAYLLDTHLHQTFQVCCCCQSTYQNGDTVVYGQGVAVTKHSGATHNVPFSLQRQQFDS